MIAASPEALSRAGDVEDLDQESEVGLVQDWIDGLINEVKSSTRPFPKVVRKWDLGVPQAKPAAAIYKPNSLD